MTKTSMGVFGALRQDHQITLTEQFLEFSQSNSMCLTSSVLWYPVCLARLI